MKQMKKTACILCAAAVTLLSVTPAFAAEPEVEQEVLSHTFNAYQIFKAEAVDNEFLTGVEWGSGFASESDVNAFLSELKTGSQFVVDGTAIFADCADAEKTARVLDLYEDDSDVVKAFADCAFANVSVPFGGKTYSDNDVISEAGYYLFEDASASNVINPVILKMAADSKVHIEVKASVPMAEKKVLENSYHVDYESKTIVSQDGASVPLHYGEGYNDAADYCVGDLVPFELIGTLPANIGDFATYYYAFKDTLSAGLTFVADGLTVTLCNVTDGTYAPAGDVTDSFTVTSDAQTGEITVACEDLTAVAGLTPDSVLIVRYNARLNDKAVVGLDGNPNEVYLEYSRTPQAPESHGETPVDEVIVFTYALEVTKVDIDGVPLENAEFCLLNADGAYYADDRSWTTDSAKAKVLKSGADGRIVVTGLDEGVYTLRETKAPDAFKLLSGDIRFTITAGILCDISDDTAQTWTGTAADALKTLAATVDADHNPDNAVTDIGTTGLDGGAVTFRVVNARIFALPGTGGAGTVLFYAGGAALLAAAVVLIIIKRKKA